MNRKSCRIATCVRQKPAAVHARTHNKSQVALMEHRAPTDLLACQSSRLLTSLSLRHLLHPLIHHSPAVLVHVGQARLVLQHIAQLANMRQQLPHLLARQRPTGAGATLAAPAGPIRPLCPRVACPGRSFCLPLVGANLQAARVVWQPRCEGPGTKIRQLLINKIYNLTFPTTHTECLPVPRRWRQSA